MPPSGEVLRGLVAKRPAGLVDQDEGLGPGAVVVYSLAALGYAWGGVMCGRRSVVFE